MGIFSGGSFKGSFNGIYNRVLPCRGSFKGSNYRVLGYKAPYIVP